VKKWFYGYRLTQRHTQLIHFKEPVQLYNPGTRNLKLETILYLILYKKTLQKVLTVHNVWCT